MTRSHMVIITTICLAILAGCQSQMRISVHRVTNAEAKRLQSDSKLGRTVSAASESLSSLIVYCNDLGRIVSQWQGQHKNVADALEPFRELIERTAATARQLSALCDASWDPAVSDSVTEDIRDTLRKVDTLFRAEVPNIRSLHDELKMNSAIARLSSADEVAATVSKMTQVGLNYFATKMRAGFMGAVASDVYEINPSDPKYRLIFSNQNALAGPPVHWEPFTSAKVGVTGDSSVMIVMEHLGQVRVYQVSNDPSQITRNIALIVSKASGAVAKFSAVGG